MREGPRDDRSALETGPSWWKRRAPLIDTGPRMPRLPVDAGTAVHNGVVVSWLVPIGAGGGPPVVAVKLLPGGRGWSRSFVA